MGPSAWEIIHHHHLHPTSHRARLYASSLSALPPPRRRLDETSVTWEVAFFVLIRLLTPLLPRSSAEPLPSSQLARAAPIPASNLIVPKETPPSYLSPSPVNIQFAILASDCPRLPLSWSPPLATRLLEDQSYTVFDNQAQSQPPHRALRQTNQTRPQVWRPVALPAQPTSTDHGPANDVSHISQLYRCFASAALLLISNHHQIGSPSCYVNYTFCQSSTNTNTNTCSALSMSASHSVRSVEDTELGLTQGEIQLLRRQQEIMAQRSLQGGNTDRGRGTSRHSHQSSRAASAASSTGPTNRVILDSRHLQALQTHLDNVMRQIENRINELEDATERTVNTSSDRHGRTVQNADAEIERMHRIIAEIDRLDADFKRIAHIKEVVKRLRARVETTDSRVDRVTSTQQSQAARDRHRR